MEIQLVEPDAVFLFVCVNGTAVWYRLPRLSSESLQTQSIPSFLVHVAIIESKPRQKQNFCSVSVHIDSMELNLLQKQNLASVSAIFANMELHAPSV